MLALYDMTFKQAENAEISTESLTKPMIQALDDSNGGVPRSPARSVHTSLSPSSHASAQTSSTDVYERQEREAEETFNQLIEKLCQELWPSPTSIRHRFIASQAVTRLRTNKFFRFFVPAPQTPLIQHLEGGGFNHITSITLPPSHVQGHRNLILRVPREDNSRPEQQVATLNYVRQRTSIPVARVEAADFTCNNAVGKPYVLQHRIPGRDLMSIWDDLSHSQRCTIAKEVGQLIAILLSVESPVAGTIAAVTSGECTSAELPKIVPFILTDAHGDSIEELEPVHAINAGNFCSCQPTMEFFDCYFSRWRRAALAESLGEIDGHVKLYDDLLKVAHEMDDLGLFKPNLNCLCHLDLHPRNIMVEVLPEDSIRITGILDWDEAVVAPKFVNCQPPGWLWGYDKDAHTENSLLPWPYELEGANDAPPTLEQQELKSIFDEHAGLEYPRLAYEESSRLMRGLYRIATLGLTASWYYTAAERIVKEWNILRPTLAQRA